MSLFKWPLSSGDDVELKDGRRGKVAGHKPEGYVDVRIKDQYGQVKTKSVFGANLRRISGKK